MGDSWKEMKSLLKDWHRTAAKGSNYFGWSHGAVDDRISCVYPKNNESLEAVGREFRRHFKSEISLFPPIHWVNTLLTQGTLLYRRPVGVPQTVRTPENVERVRQTMQRSPNRSAWRNCIVLGIGNRSVKRILHEDLCLHSKKLIVVQQLKPGDYAKRLNFAGQIKAVFEANDNPTLLMSDEAHFHLNGIYRTVVIGLFKIRENCM